MMLFTKTGVDKKGYARPIRISFIGAPRLAKEELIRRLVEERELPKTQAEFAVLHYAARKRLPRLVEDEERKTVEWVDTEEGRKDALLALAEEQIDLLLSFWGLGAVEGPPPGASRADMALQKLATLIQEGKLADRNLARSMLRALKRGVPAEHSGPLSGALVEVVRNAKAKGVLSTISVLCGASEVEEGEERSLFAIAADPEVDVEVRGNVIRLLGERGDDRAFSFLMELVMRGEDAEYPKLLPAVRDGFRVFYESDARRLQRALEPLRDHGSETVRSWAKDLSWAFPLVVPPAAADARPPRAGRKGSKGRRARSSRK